MNHVMPLLAIYCFCVNYGLMMIFSWNALETVFPTNI